MKEANVPYDSKYLTSWKRSNYGNSKKIRSVVAGEREGDVVRGVSRWSRGDFQSNESNLYNIVTVDILCSLLGKNPWNYTIQGVKLNVTYVISLILSILVYHL